MKLDPSLLSPSMKARNPALFQKQLSTTPHLAQATSAADEIPDYEKPKPIQSGHSGSIAVVERNSTIEPMATTQVQAADSKRILVRVTSFRRRLLDEDNLCEKYLVDCLRYAGIIPSDAPQKAKIEVSQCKVLRNDEEFTRIEVSEITPTEIPHE